MEIELIIEQTMRNDEEAWRLFHSAPTAYTVYVITTVTSINLITITTIIRVTVV